MEDRGIIRKIDQLGRVVIPIEYRKNLDLNPRDNIKMTLVNNRIVIDKYTERCVFCGNKNRLREYRGKWICPKCAVDLKKRI